jgi:hypothetical protein
MSWHPLKPFYYWKTPNNIGIKIEVETLSIKEVLILEVLDASPFNPVIIMIRPGANVIKLFVLDLRIFVLS